MKLRPWTIDVGRTGAFTAWAFVCACATFLAGSGCAAGDVPDEPEPVSLAKPSFKLSIAVRQGRKRIALRDNMEIKLARKSFAVHFLARDFTDGRCDTLAVAARETDITREKFLGRRRVETRAFVNGGEAAAHGDRAQSWLILSPFAFASVYYCAMDERRTDFVESWSPGVMELRFYVRELLIDGRDASTPVRKLTPGRFPSRIYTVFFMDLNGDGVMDANEFMRVRFLFE